MGHGSPRCLSSCRYGMRTRFGETGEPAEPADPAPLPYGAASSGADIVVDRPSVVEACCQVPARCADGVPVERDTVRGHLARRCDQVHTSEGAQLEPVVARPAVGATIMIATSNDRSRGGEDVRHE